MILFFDESWIHPVLSDVFVVHVQGVDPELGAVSRDCILHEVRVKVHQLRIFSLGVDHAHKVECFVVHTPSYATAGLKMEHFFEALQVFRLDIVQPKPHRDTHKNAISFGNFLVNFVEEYVPIVADDDAEVHNRLDLFVELVQDVTNGLGSVPVSRVALEL